MPSMDDTKLKAAMIAKNSRVEKNRIIRLSKLSTNRPAKALKMIVPT